MSCSIVLVSDDEDFFAYTKPKLDLRCNDEILCLSFDVICEKIFSLDSAILIVNSESSREKTIDVIKIFSDFPVIVSAFNKDIDFENKCYELGCFGYFTLLMPDINFKNLLLNALKVSSIIEKKLCYREILEKNDYINSKDDVFINFNNLLDIELEKINKNKQKAIFAAISPSDKVKFLINSDVIESTILNNIRKNDLLMSYAANKYFILMYGVSEESFKNVWKKISTFLPQKLYIGYSCVIGQKRQQIINEVLNKLHQAINNNKDFVDIEPSMPEKFEDLRYLPTSQNFKQFRQNYLKSLERVINPVFYNIQQKYLSKLSGARIQLEDAESAKIFNIKGKKSSCSFKISSPGFSKINIDITYNNENVTNSKRITLDPNELEEGLLGDLLEQLVVEYKSLRL